MASSASVPHTCARQVQKVIHVWMQFSGDNGMQVVPHRRCKARNKKLWNTPVSNSIEDFGRSWSHLHLATKRLGETVGVERDRGDQSQERDEWRKTNRDIAEQFWLTRVQEKKSLQFALPAYGQA